MPAMTLFVILASVAMSACAQLALKVGMSAPKTGYAAKGDSLVHVAFAALASPLVWLGLVIYGLSVLLWLWVLSKTELSLAYPFVGLSFIMTLAFGAFLLGENVTLMRVLGAGLIVCGCVLVGRSA
ncbi:MAG: EamA family transporter [Pseudomonadota bacterium]